MNILIFSWRGPKHPNSGGAEISTHEHAKGWVKAGHDVTLFTSVFVGCRKQEVINGVKIERRGRQILGVQWEAFKWYMFGKHLKFDLVVDQFHGIPFFTPLYVGAKKLAFIHEVTKEVWRLNPWPWPFNKIAAFVGEIFEPVIFRLYKKIPFMTVSNSTKNDLVVWGILKDQIKIVYNGITVPKIIKKTRKEDKKTLIFLGALSKDKGIEDALKIFQLITQSAKEEWKFWVVGEVDPRYLKKLRLQTQKLGIYKRIKFWGFVNEKKKFELLSRAHVAINTSIREGWGLVVVEAAAMGIPTVSFNVPGLRDSIINGKTGIICSKNKIKDLADRILKLVDDEKRYRLISQNAVMWSKRFSWRKSIKESLGLINNLVKD